MRLFVAIAIPEGVRRSIAAATASLCAQLPETRWVPEENLHLTLQFLGERPASDLETLGEGLAAVFPRYHALPLKLAAADSFPSRNPRVVWLGLRAPSNLGLLQRQVAEVTGELRLGDGRSRPFRPHVTLGRCRERWQAEDRERLVAGLAEVSGIPFLADRGVLYRSELSPAGARHSEVQTFPLQGSVHGSSHGSELDPP